MKNLFFALAASTLAMPAFAGSDFSCEQIKEKSVRSSCIAARVQSLNEKKAADDAAEERRAADASRRAELDEFVAKAKKLLTENYKDPQGAQFTELTIAENKVAKTLCGTVNGKNSYGGYVGPKKFYVSLWVDPFMPLPPRVWTEGESTRNYRSADNQEMQRALSKLEDTEARNASAVCSASDTTTVTPVR